MPPTRAFASSAKGLKDEPAIAMSCVTAFCWRFSKSAPAYSARISPVAGSIEDRATFWYAGSQPSTSFIPSAAATA